jgi:exodeoxyribonuclease VII small subunit
VSFEASLDRLDKIVAQLQRDDVPLDQALGLFEEGVRHVQAAAQALALAEAKVQALVEGPDGSLEVTPLAG